MSASCLNWCLVLQYIVLCGWYLCDGNWLKAWYWAGAAVISSAVALMR